MPTVQPMIPTCNDSLHGYQLLTKRLEGKVAIITGGANGIGEATTRVFTAHGAKVVIADIDDSSGLALANQLAPLAVYIHCDVSSERDVQRLVDETLSRFHKLDVMFNNAGVLGGQSKKRKISIVDLDAEELDRVMGVNVRGTALGMKYAARAMVPRRSGCIISTASVAGLMGGLGPHAYAASKHAIVGLTKNAACELGRYGIRVNCVSPFGVATRMLVKAWRDDYDGDENEQIEISGEEVERMEELVMGLSNLKLGVSLKARDVAEAILYLASDDSSYVSGHNLVVDGAFTASNNSLGIF